MSRQRGPGVALVLIGALVLVFFTGRWTSDTHWSSWEPPDDCTWDGQTLVLSYTYGANDDVAPAVQSDPDAITVSIRVHHRGGSSVAIGLGGTATFAVYGGDRPIVTPDGQPVDCPAPESLPGQ